MVTLLRLFLFCFYSIAAYAGQDCFIAKENGQIIKQMGPCDKRHSPFSTFKVPIALMGFEAGILKSASVPSVKIDPVTEKKLLTADLTKYPHILLWKREQTPRTWIRDSVVWYSQYITQQLGIKKFLAAVHQLHYGNEDVRSDGLMDAWLGNSLGISPAEQADFMEKLASRTLPISQEAQEKTIPLLKMETMAEGWQLYGKTGGSIKQGWFIGWVEKGDRRIAFAQYVEQPEDSLITAGKVAKELARDNLLSLILE